MRRWLWLLLATPALAQTSLVSGTIQTYNPAIAPNALGNYVEFQLTNCGNNTPTVSGTAVLMNKPIDFYPDATGALTAASNGGIQPTLYGNDVINCGGAFTSRYSVRYFVGGVAQGPAKFYTVLSTAPFNLTTALPINVQPPLNPPYPNLTNCAPGSYTNGLNKDLSVKCLNLPSGASNAVVTNPTAQQEIGNQPLKLDGNLLGFTGTFQNLNGMVNATTFAGGDLGAQINAATASCSDAVPCHVFIPPGVYTFSTPVLLPRRAQGLELTCDRNATLTYTGVGSAFSTQPAVASTNDAGTMLDGGCALIGTSAATAGVHFRPGQGYSLIGWQIKGFSAGDGIWVDGANVVWITGTSARFNLNGLHVTGNRCNASNACRWDRPSSPTTWVDSGINDSGYAANAVKAAMNRFTQNVHWGILDGDVVGGSNTQSFANRYVDNDLEGNGTAGAPYGAALLGFSRDATFEGNYLEGNPAGIVVGCTSGTPSGVMPQTGYTTQFCGTADKTVVKDNFFNDNTTASEVLLNFSNSPTVADNGLNSNAACLVDNNTSLGNIDISNNIIYGSGAYTCQNGTPGGTLVNYRHGGDSTVAAHHFYGTVQVDNTLQTQTLVKFNQLNPSMTGTQLIVGQMGAWTFWQAGSQPGGTCGGASTTFNLMVWPGGMSICNGGSTWKVVQAI